MRYAFFIILFLYTQRVDVAQADLLPFDCELTPIVAPAHMTLKPIETSNNLRRKEGAGVVASGIYTEIHGRVLDRFCVPVTNAVVKLWQTDRAGNYIEHYTLQSEWDVMDVNYDPNFAYTGTARTNNLGQFFFLTILPGAYGNKAPHLNIQVNHTDFDEISTQIFLAKHPRNSTDPDLKRLLPRQQALLTAKGEPIDPKYEFEGRKYRFDVTLDGVNNYQRF